MTHRAHTPLNVGRWIGRLAAGVALVPALAAAQPAVSMNPPSLAFGAQSMGTTSPAQVVTLTNTGNATLTVTAVNPDPQFPLTTTCATVAPAASCTITVTFAPIPDATPLNGTAAVSGFITVDSNAAGSPHSMAVGGTGEKSLVTHYYRSIFRRAPDAPGKAFWTSETSRLVDTLGGNANEVWYAMALQFFASNEYLSFGRSNTEYVTDLYKTFFNRAPDAGGLAYWVGQLNSGLPREIALAGFMFTPEFTGFAQSIFGNTAVRKEVDVVMDLYRGLLARLPDSGGFGFWVNQFRTAQCQGPAQVTTQAATMSSQFLGGTEYSNRLRSNAQVVGDFYNAFLRRGGDLTGAQYWTNQLDVGAMSRDQVRGAFVASAEFGARVTAVIDQGCLTPPLNCTDANVLCVGGPTAEYGTIQDAINAANPAAGKTVLVFDGTWGGFTIPANRSGTANNRFTVKAQGLNAVIGSANGRGEGVTISNADYVTVDGFKVNGMSGHGIACHDASSVDPMVGVTIRNNIATNNGISNIYCSNAAESLIENNVATGAKAEHGIYLANGGADNTTIRGNVLSGNFRNGLHLNGDLSVGGDGLHTGVVIEGNTIFGNTDNAMDLDGLYDSTIRNNLIYGNGHHGIRVFQIDAAAGAGNLRIVNNTIVIPNPSNGGSPIKLTADVGGHTIFNNILINLGTSGTIVTGNVNFKSNYNIVVNSGFSVNEGSTLLNFTQWKALAGAYDANSVLSDVTSLFVAPGSNDYRLKSGSPAANTGTAAFNGYSAPAMDIVNIPRPQGAAVDRGAYESF